MDLDAHIAQYIELNPSRPGLGNARLDTTTPPYLHAV